jgi:hypothetical protein
MTSPHEIAHQLLHRYWADADRQAEVRNALAHAATQNPDALAEALRALEHVMHTSIGDGTLVHLVASSANQSLDDASEAAAQQWLSHAAAMVRQVL